MPTHDDDDEFYLTPTKWGDRKIMYPLFRGDR